MGIGLDLPFPNRGVSGIQGQVQPGGLALGDLGGVGPALRLQLHPLAVADVDHEDDDFPLAEAGVPLHPEGTAILAAYQGLACMQGRSALPGVDQVALPDGADFLTIDRVGIGQVPPGIDVGQVLAAIAEEMGEGGREVKEPALVVQDRHRRRGVLEQQAQYPVLPRQPLAGGS